MGASVRWEALKPTLLNLAPKIVLICGDGASELSQNQENLFFLEILLETAIWRAVSCRFKIRADSYFPGGFLTPLKCELIMKKIICVLTLQFAPLGIQ